MAPALTAEPLSPKEKLTSNASPATGTRQSVRKLDSPSGGVGGDTAKKPITLTATTRVTRSKDVAQRTGSPIVSVNNNNNKRKANNHSSNNNNNNNNSSCSSNTSEAKSEENQMGLSAATTHTSSDGSAGATAAAAVAAASSSSSSSSSSGIPSDAAAVAPAAVITEHNNNNNNNSCKDNSTAELLANLTSGIEEALTAEICLRKTLPDVSHSKEQPAETEAAAGGGGGGAAAAAAAVVAAAVEAIAHSVQLLEPALMAETEAQSQSTSAAAAAAAVVAAAATPATAEEAAADAIQRLLDASSKITTDNIEECLSQLDGSPSVVLPPIVEKSGSTLVTGEPVVPTTPTRQLEPPQQLPLPLPQPQQQLPLQAPQQPQQQQQPEILASPQHSAAARQSGAVLTPQSTASSINFLKDGGAGAVLEDQDIEEVLKALRTFDGGHVNPDTICDFNFFNDFPYNEEEAAAAAAAAAGTAPGSTAAPAAAAAGTGIVPAVAPAPAVGVANVGGSQELEALSCNPAIATRPYQEILGELEQQQHALKRKYEFLVRRMRKFQARQMCRHASDEVAGILEWSARSSHKAAPGPPARSAKLTEKEDTVLSIVSGRPTNGFWEEQTKHPLPASQMSNVLRHIETAAQKQQICHTTGGGSSSLASSSSWYSSAAQPGKRARKTQAQMDASINNSSSNSNNNSMVPGATDGLITPRADEIVPNFDNYVTSELTHVSGLLHTEMREIQNAMDSDATESSSGGDSADEMVNYNNSQQLSLPITRRAVWRYSRDRAVIALRWSWLCAQVTDLEIKIRQHHDVYNDLSRTKGDVLLEATPAPKNGYKEQPQLDGGDEAPEDWLCSRARPLVLSEFRKRKLFQTTNMHTISKKAARPSNIKCGCQWPQVPCTLCTGRPDPTAPRDLPETLMPQNRVALLDPGYHPVLSFTDDVTQSVHLEAISRQPDWQYRVMRSQAKAIVKSVWKAEREAIAASGGGAGGAAGGAGRRPGETAKRRYVRRKERNNNNQNRSTSNNNNNNNNNTNNNNNNNNKETTQNNNNNNSGSSGLSHVGLDSGNGTGTATTSSSSTPTTTPLVANTSKRQRPSGTSRVGAPQPDPQANSYALNSGNGGKKSRKSASKTQQQQQQQQPHQTHSALINNNSNNNNSRSRCSSSSQQPGDSPWESQQHSRRNSSETHGPRHERSTAERRSRVIYDIDNIVIPYSMAAQTRVEILPYKEIPTPKWRIVDSDNEQQQQQTTNEAGNGEKLSNGCAEAEERGEQLKKDTLTAAVAAAATTATAAAAEASTATKPAATAATKTAATATTPAPKTTTNGKTETAPAAEKAAKATLAATTKTEATKVTAAATTAAATTATPTTVATTTTTTAAGDTKKSKSTAAATETTTTTVAKTTPTTTTTTTTAGAATINSTTTSAKPASTTKTIIPSTATTTAATTTTTTINPSATKTLKLSNKKELKEKESKSKNKLNGLKHSKKEKKEKKKKKKKKKRLAEAEKPAEAQPKPNGLLNGKADQSDPGAKVTPATPNGITKKHNNKVSVNNVNKASLPVATSAPAASKEVTAEPLKKRPKLQLAEEVQQQMEPTNVVEEEEEEEDISDEAYIARHQRALIEERRRFETFLKFPGGNRPRANRRTDSRAESSGANTPDPASPAASHLTESIPSPLAQSMLQHPLDAFEGETTKRRRTTSSKLKDHERRSATPDTRDERPPFEPLQFPLSEEVYQRLLAEMHIEPKEPSLPTPVVTAPAKRTKSKSVSSNGDGAPTAATSRRNSKAKGKTTMQQNGGRKTKQAAAAQHQSNGGQVAVGYDDGIDYEPEEDDEDEELLLEEDDDYHYLAPPEDEPLPAATSDISAYNASIDAYLGEGEALDEEDIGDDPFMDDDPNDPEWKRNAGVRHERVRKRV